MKLKKSEGFRDYLARGDEDDGEGIELPGNKSIILLLLSNSSSCCLALLVAFELLMCYFEFDIRE